MHFASSPENLRLGKAIEAFTKADRIVVGVRSEEARAVLQGSARAHTVPNIIWVSVEAAEMTKHALNAFLATSADVHQRDRDAVRARRGRRCRRGRTAALRSEPRIGQRAYIRPGSGFRRRNAGA